LDIHPVHGSIRSVKDFFLHLLTITVGILIALSLEATVEWFHYRHLVHEAETNLASEIRANQDELTKTVAGLRITDQQLRRFIALVHALESDRSTTIHDLAFNWTVASLHTTSWNTASATGAIAHMDYDEVQRYTRVYVLQQQYVSLQERAFASANAVVGLTTLLDKDAKKISESELENAERTLGLALANTSAEQDIAAALIAEYRQFAQSN
jgi:hypothetical protein